MDLQFKKVLLLFVIFLSNKQLIQAQSAQETFGKNRIQHQDFKWSMMSTDNFDIYYYPQSKSDAILAANYAEYEYERITEFLGYTPYSRIKLIVYATHSDLLQSNIGLVGQKVFIGGYTVFLKNKVEVSFNGIQTDFQKDISRGIGQMILNEMIFAGNFKEVLQSTYFMNLPEWFLSGLVEYMAIGWNSETDDKIRDIFATRKFKRPNRFTGEDATTVGFSIWNYFVERYGKASVSNILGETKIRKNHEKAIEEVLTKPYKLQLKEWREYYLNMTKLVKDTLAIPADSIKIIKYTRDETHYGSIKLSPDGTRMAYVQNRKGRYKVFVKNLQTGKKFIVYRGGFRTFDQKVNFDLPVVAWRNNDKIGIIAVKQDKMKLVTYDIKQEIKNKKERFKLEVSNFFNIRYTQKQTYRGIYKHFKQVNDFNFSEDGATIVLSGENKLGQSDIFIYNLRNNNVTAITNDIFDDRNPIFLPKTTKSFVFNSNRTLDTLSPKQKIDFRKLKNNHDIFYYNMDSSKLVARRITNSRYNEINPKMNKEGDIFFLSDENGVYELYKTNADRETPKAVTNFRQSIESYDISNTESDLAFMMNVNGKRRFFLDTNFNFNVTYDFLPKTMRQVMLDNTIYNKSLIDKMPQVTNRLPVVTRYELTQARKNSKPQVDTTDIDIENYVFEFEKKNWPSKTGDTSKMESSEKPTSKARVIDVKVRYNEIYFSSPVRYKNDFGIDNVTSTLRIDPLRGTGIQGVAHMSDLMANHRINAGLFGVLNFRTSIMWLEYEYLKKRLDFKFRYTKDALYWNPSNGITHKYKLNKYEATVAYPFNPAVRISATPYYANTKFTNLSIFSIPQGLATPDISYDYLGINLEFNFDNVRSKGLNLNEGTRVKFGFTGQAGLGNPEKSFSKFYVDARNYFRIHKDLTLCNRVTAGSFSGRGRKNFLLGGMDNWYFNSTNTSEVDNPIATAPQTDNTDLLFNEYVTNLRGFSYNQLFGNNFVLYNIELKVPLFKYLIGRQIKSNFIRNFQVAGFYDIGTAWSGENPLSRDNSYNTQVITREPFSANIINYRSPFISGYGFGVRSMIFGYYTKIDVAWGQQNYLTQPVKFYLTMGYDF